LSHWIHILAGLLIAEILILLVQESKVVLRIDSSRRD